MRRHRPEDAKLLDATLFIRFKNPELSGGEKLPAKSQITAEKPTRGIASAQTAVSRRWSVNLVGHLVG